MEAIQRKKEKKNRPDRTQTGRPRVHWYRRALPCHRHFQSLRTVVSHDKTKRSAWHNPGEPCGRRYDPDLPKTKRKGRLNFCFDLTRQKSYTECQYFFLFYKNRCYFKFWKRILVFPPCTENEGVTDQFINETVELRDGFPGSFSSCGRH